MAPRASIVIRAFNEAAHLPRLFDGIATQTVRDVETIVVDSGSVDGTLDIARARCDRVVEIASHDFTFGFSLNRGCAAATAETIVIVSAHTYPAHERWLEALLGGFGAADAVALVYGGQLPVDVTKPSERHELATLFGPSRRVQHAPDYYCNNANAAVPRALWEEHPYDETLTGVEDQGWAKHWLDRGWVAVYEPAAAVHHVHDESWAQVERRYYREAFARRRLGVDRRRRIPLHLGAGARELVRDVLALHSERRMDRSALQSVVRYRYRQTKGTVRGLVHDYEPEREHQELFFDRANEAVVIAGPGEAALQRTPLPDVKPNDVMVRVAYVGVCATDLEVLSGSLGYYRNGWAKYPIVPGHEYSGVVVKRGANVTGVEVGDRVVGACILGCLHCSACLAGNPIACERRREVGVLNQDGAYARFLALPSQYVFRLPPDADLRKHALVEPLAVIQKALSRIHELPPRARCLVVGAGPIGHLTVQTLLAAGHDVTVYDRNPLRREVLPPQVETRADLSELTGFDLVVEATGSRDALEEVLAGVGTGARVLLLGLPYGNVQLDVERLVAFDRSVVGSVGSGPADFERALELLPRLALDELTANVVPLERFEEAWRRQRDASVLKVLLEVAPPDAT